MHQVFYIDVDEEVTSVIERLRNSKASEVFFVVPARSLLMQSMVSLRLLKKEAENKNKNIIFVTPDPQNKIKLEKEKIAVKQTLEGLEESQEVKEGMIPYFKKDSSKSSIFLNEENKIQNLQKVGSQGFYAEKKHEDPVLPSVLSIVKETPSASEASFSKSESLLNRELAWGKTEEEKTIKSPVRYKNPSMDITHAKGNDSPYRSEKYPEEGKSEIAGQKFNQDKKTFIGSQSADIHKEKKFNSFFNHHEKEFYIKENKESQKIKIPASGTLKKTFIFFIVLFLTVIFGIAAYFILPKAKVVVVPKSKFIESDLKIKGMGNAQEIDYEKKIVPAKIIEKEESLTLSFESSGKIYSSGQKAKGAIFIYNEYNSSPQQLVATTRLLAKNGKLFRLVKGITVPGMSEVNGEKKPGVIEAEIIADEPGEDFNVEPTEFSIPGFEGGPKYDKFYGKSTKKMTGGGSKGEAIKSVSEADIEKAKKETLENLEKQILEKIKSTLSPEEMWIESLAEKTVIESASLAKAESVSSTFEYKAKMKLRNIVFSKNDIGKIFRESWKKDNADFEKIDISAIEIEYLNSSADFSLQEIELKAHGKFSEKEDISLGDLKTAIVGKSEGEVKKIIKDGYSQVDRIDIDFWPGFFSGRMPMLKERIEMQYGD